MSNLFSSGGAGNVGFSGETQQSLKFNDDESPYLLRTPTTAGNRQTWSISMWVKRGNLGISQAQLFEAGTSGGSGSRLFWYFNSSDQIQLSSGTVNYGASGARSLRDPSAWYHILIQCSGGSIKHYINGELDITHSISGDTAVNSLVPHAIFSRADSTGTNSMDGYVAQVALFDGTAYTTADVTNTENGVLTVKSDLSGLTFGTNGFHLTFQDDVVSEGFNTITYRGNGGTQSLSGLGMEADLVWIKERSSTSGHVLTDTVRGANKHLVSSSNGAETTVSNGLTSFDADGFSVGSNGAYNQSGETYVAWAWDAGTGSAASNTNGTITSSVKANTDYGFSIGKFTKGSGTETVGHGLSATPDWLLVKRTNGTGSWIVYHSANTANPETDYLRLNSSNGTADEATFWNDTAPTSTVFTVGAAFNSGEELVFYAWTEISSYSKFSSYTGSGSSGNSVTGLGFKPAFLMVKRTDAATTYSNWWIQDATRNPTNVGNTLNLAADNSNAETNALEIDFDSDGFTLQDGSQGSNISGATYIYMAFADTREAAFWKDVSGQGNHWTPNNLDYRDSLIDSPANNFATLQPTAFVNTGGANSAQSLSEGNLRFTGTSTEGRSTPATMRVTSGKYYVEATKVSGSGSVNVDFIVNDTRVAGKSTSTTGDIIIGAVDVDAGKYWSGLNNTWDSSGDPATGANPTGTFTANSSFTFGGRVYDTARVGHFNFGQDSTFSGATTAGGNQDDNGVGDFKYAPPSGYLALCTANLPTPTIVDGTEHFNTVLYTGTGSQMSITGVGFQPDFFWNKSRSTTGSNAVNDSVRGANARLNTDSTAAETTQSGFPVSYDSDGVTLNSFITSGKTYVLWNWKAGGTAVSNTDGSITSSVSANTDAGFSIVSYVGTGALATVGHSLGVKPSMMIIKNRDDSDAGSAHWLVYHEALGATHRVKLDSTEASGATAVHFNNTEPTSSVFTVNTSNAGNGSGDDMIAYVFANTDGYLKAGSYTGNGSSDGPMVFTNGRPAWFLVKRSDSGTHHWRLFDSARSTFNDVDDYLAPSNSNAEAVGKDVDFVSNGVKIRTTDSDLNTSGGTYIYLCIMETPFKFSPAR